MFLESSVIVLDAVCMCLCVTGFVLLCVLALSLCLLLYSLAKELLISMALSD